MFLIHFKNCRRFEGTERKLKENLVNRAENSVSLNSGVLINIWDHKDNGCRQHFYQGISENMMHCFDKLHLNIGLYFVYFGFHVAISAVKVKIKNQFADDKLKSTNSQKHCNKRSSGQSRSKVFQTNWLFGILTSVLPLYVKYF